MQMGRNPGRLRLQLAIMTLQCIPPWVIAQIARRHYTSIKNFSEIVSLAAMIAIRRIVTTRLKNCYNRAMKSVAKLGSQHGCFSAASHHQHIGIISMPYLLRDRIILWNGVVNELMSCATSVGSSG
jgi:hypothetical protein